MRIIRPRRQNVSRYATLNRPHYICPECKIHIVRDRETDMFMCMQCGRKETRSEFRHTLIKNVAVHQEEWKESRKVDARRERLRRSLNRDAFREQVGSVYYIQLQGLIKIGTTTSLRERLSNLPWDSLLLAEPGWYAKERERHHQFAELQHDGEWFRAEPPLLEFISHRRNEIAEENLKRFGDRPGFPWRKREVKLPTVYEVAENIHDQLDWGDAIEVDEIEYSGKHYCNDPKDVIGF